MEGEIGVTRSMSDENPSLDIQGDQIEGESSVTHSSDIQADQMEGESSVTRSMIDELHSSDIQVD